MKSSRSSRTAAALFSAFCIAGPILAQDAAPEDKALPERDRKVSFLAGLDFMPKLSWHAKPMAAKETYLTYAFQDSQLTTLTGSLVSTKLGLSLGFDAAVDNNKVNKAYKFGTFLGYKKLVLRVQSSSIQGAASWGSTLAPGQVADITFKNKYSNVDILYFKKSKKQVDDGMQLYFGLGYSSFQMPVQIDTLTTPSDKAHQVYGIATFDPNFKVTAYSFLFGFDMMLGSVLSAHPKTGWGVLMSTQDRFGVGETIMSDEAKAAAKALNGGVREPKSGHNTVGMVDYDLALGVSYTYVNGRTRASLGLGYNYGATVVVDWTGAANNPNQLGYESAFSLQRNGPIVRAYFVF